MKGKPGGTYNRLIKEKKGSDWKSTAESVETEACVEAVKEVHGGGG